MPYYIIEAGDRVIANGRKGVVIAVGSLMNKSAHFLVRLDGRKDAAWFSRDEVVPDDSQEEQDLGT